MREMLCNPAVKVRVGCEGDLAETAGGLGLGTSVLGVTI